MGKLIKIGERTAKSSFETAPIQRALPKKNTLKLPERTTVPGREKAVHQPVSPKKGPTFGERVEKGAQSIGETLKATPGVLMDTMKQTWDNTMANDRMRQTQAYSDLAAQLAKARKGRLYFSEGHPKRAEVEKEISALEARMAAMQTKDAVSMDTPAMQRMAKAAQLREEALEGLEGAPRLMADAALSIGQNAVLLPTAVINPAIPLAAMGAQSAADKMYELSAQGVSADDALARGLVSGTIEGATEKIPLDNVLDLVKTGGKSAVRSILRQAGVEATEEGVSYTLNYLADKASKDPNAKFDVNDLLYSAAVGGVSGGFFGTVGTGVNKVATDTAVGQQVKDNGQVYAILERGMNAQEGSKVRRTAESIYNTLEKSDNGMAAVSDARMGRLVKAMQKDAMQNAKPAAQTVQVAQAPEVQTVEKPAVQKVGRSVQAFIQAGDSPAAAEVKGAVMDRILAGDTTVSGKDLRSIGMSAPSTKAVFTQLTGIDVPSTTDTNTLLATYRSAILRAAELKAQIVAQAEARTEEAATPMQEQAETSAQAEEMGHAAQSAPESEAPVAAPVAVQTAEEEDPWNGGKTAAPVPEQAFAETADQEGPTVQVTGGRSMDRAQFTRAYLAATPGATEADAERAFALAGQANGFGQEYPMPQSGERYKVGKGNRKSKAEKVAQAQRKARAGNAVRAENADTAERVEYVQESGDTAAERESAVHADAAPETDAGAEKQARGDVDAAETEKAAEATAEPVEEAGKRELSKVQKLALRDLNRAVKSSGITVEVVYGDEALGEANGYYAKGSGRLVLNGDVLTDAQLLIETAAHELVHAGVKTDEGLVQSLLDFGVALKGQAAMDRNLEELRERYMGFLMEHQGLSREEAAATTTVEYIQEEQAADLMGEVFGSTDALYRMAKYDKTLYQKVRDRVARGLSELILGKQENSPIRTEAEWLVHRLDNALNRLERESGKTAAKTQTQTETQTQTQAEEKALQDRKADDTMGKTEDTGKEDAEYGRAREETQEDFKRRCLEEGYQFLEIGGAGYGFRRAGQPDDGRTGEQATRSAQTKQELTALGISADVVEGPILQNRNGITTVREVPEAVTVKGSHIFINKDTALAPRNIVGHEAFHLWKNRPGRDAYIETVEDNLLFTSETFREYQSAIAEAYLGGEADLTDSTQAGKLFEEIFAYISGQIHEGTNDAALRPMFRDFDAVKAAWETLVKENGAEAKTEKAPKTGKKAEDGQSAARKKLLKKLEDGGRVPFAELSQEEAEAFSALSGELGVDEELRIFRPAPEHHIRQRTADGVGARSMNAFQFDFPVVKGFYEQVAKVLLQDAADSLEVPAVSRVGRGPQGKQRVQEIVKSGSLKKAMDLGLTRGQIIRGAEALIQGGREANNAASKRLELVLDDMLSNGYFTMDGTQVSPDAEYLDVVQKIPGYQDYAVEELPLYADADRRFKLNPDFGKQFDEWLKSGRQSVPGSGRFLVGRTSDALRSIGVSDYKIYWSAGKLSKIMREHPAMTADTIKSVPNVLEHPVLVMQSQTVANRITLFGEAMDAEGNPVLVAVELSPQNKRGEVQDFAVIASAYGKNGAQQLIDHSDILYVDADKKRTDTWLGLLRLQLPSRLTKYGSIDRVTLVERDVNGHLSVGTEKGKTAMQIAFEKAAEKDRRFKLKAPVEETKSLIALHNRTEEKLWGDLRLGGFPMPSIAVTRTDVPHTNFGDITLVMDKRSIDPKANRKNTVYSADAWTPTFPQVEYAADPAAERRISGRLRELSGKVDEMFRQDLYRITYDMEDLLNRYGGEEGLLRQVMDNYGLKAAYLEDTGRHVSAATVQREADKGYRQDRVEKYRAIVEALGTDDPDEIGHIPLKELRDRYGDELEAAFPGMTKSTFRLSGIIRQVQAYLQDQGGAPVYETVTDATATRRAIDDVLDRDGYERWVRELYSGVQADSGIYNNKERFTPAGNRRTFQQTHYPVTLENIVKAMKGQNGGNTKNVSGFYGVKSLRAGTAKRFKSIADMHKLEGRLQNLTEEQTKAIHDELDRRLMDITEALAEKSPNGKGGFDYYLADSIGNMQVEIADGEVYTIDAIMGKFNGEYGFHIGNELAAQVRDLLFDVSQMPVNIFEAKPERAVGFDEVLAAVLPDDASGELRDALSGRGVNVLTYKAGDDADRIAKVNGVEGARFSLKSTDSKGRKLTAEQQEYFRDSVIRDDQGHLMVMYHGTRNGGFTVFDGGKDYFYFTNSRKYAYTFEGRKANGQLYPSTKEDMEAGLISPQRYEVYLNVTNPFIAEQDVVEDALYWDRSLAQQLRDRGYDALMMADMSQVIVLSPEQIKNVTNKTPTGDPDIRYSLKPDGAEDELRLNALRQERDSLAEQLDDPFSELTDAEERRLRNRLVRVQHEIDVAVEQERRAVVRMPLSTIAEHLGDYRRSDLESLAEQISNGAWDGYEDLSRTDLEDALLEALNERMEDMNPLEAQSPRFGLYVRPVSKENAVLQKEDRRFKVNPKTGFEQGSIEDSLVTLLQTGDKAQVTRGLQALVDNVQAMEEAKRQQSIRNAFQPKRTEQDMAQTRVNLDALIQKFGEMEQTGAAQREVHFPKKIDPDTKVRGFVQTVAAAGGTTQLVEDSLAEDILRGTAGTTYVPWSDKRALSKAEKALSSQEEFNRALRRWETVLLGEKMPSKDDIAVGEALYLQACAEGQVFEAQKRAAELAVMGTQMGQAIQAMSLVKRMTPAGQLYYVTKAVERLNRTDNLTKRGVELKLDTRLAKKLMDAKTAEEVQAAMEAITQDLANQMPVTVVDKWNAWRYFAMLGNPRTHFRNLIGNAVFAPTRLLKDVVATTMETGAVRAGLMNTSERTKGKASKDLKEFAKADALRMEEELRGSGKHNMRDAIMDKRQIFKNPLLEKAAKKNTELLEKEDWMFLHRYYEGALAGFLSARGFRAEQVYGPNSTPEGRAALNQGRQYAMQEARKATYRDMSRLAQNLNYAARNSGPVFQVLWGGLMPFTKTPINIVKRGVEYSPFGVAKAGLDLVASRAAVHADADTVKGRISRALSKVGNDSATPAEVIDELAAGFTGTGLVLLGYVLAQAGLLVGGLGDDEEDQFKKLQGYQSYSLKVGDKSFTIDWAAPTVLPLFVGEAMHRMAEGEEIVGAADFLDALPGLLDPVIAMSMLDGINKTLESIRYSSDNAFQAILGTIFASYISQGMPTVLGAIARTLDEDRRTTFIPKGQSGIERWVNNLWQSSVLGKIPIASKGRMAFVDNWGRKDSNGNFALRAAENFLLPGYLNTIDTTTVETELNRLAEATGDTGVYPGKAQKYFRVNGQDRVMSQDEYEAHLMLRGQKSFELVDQITNSKTYAEMADEARVQAVKTAYQYAADLAKLNTDPDYAADKWVVKLVEYEKQGGDPAEYIMLRAKEKTADISLEDQILAGAVQSGREAAGLLLIEEQKVTEFADPYSRGYVFRLDQDQQKRYEQIYHDLFASACEELMEDREFQEADAAERKKLFDKLKRNTRRDAKEAMADWLEDRGIESVERE